jgi:deoxyhypusine synthase
LFIKAITELIDKDDTAYKNVDSDDLREQVDKYFKTLANELKETKQNYTTNNMYYIFGEWFANKKILVLLNQNRDAYLVIDVNAITK